MALLLLPFASNAMLQVSSIQSPSSLGAIALFHDGLQYSVMKDGAFHPVQNYNLDNNLRTLSPKALPVLDKLGYIRINQLSDGEYKLDLQGRLKGGGPATAWFMYGAAKAFCWTTVGVTAGATVAATVATAGGGAVVATAVGSTVGKVITATGTAGMALATTAPAAGLAAGTVAAVGTTTAGGAIVAASAGIGITAAVEVVSMGWAGLFLGPWCP